MFTAGTILVICVVGIIICLNPLRQMPNYGRGARASIRNQRSYQRW